MRTVFMGNPEFAIPSLQAIHKSNFNLIAVVSNPPKPIGRKRLLHLTPVGNYAKEHEIHLIEVNSLKSENLKNQLSQLRPDIFVIVAYKILPKSLINIPRYGSINLHASLLPKYRGASPIQWALMNGDVVTGNTVFQITPSVDTGDVIIQEHVKIFNDDNMQTLSERLSKNGSDLILKAMRKIKQGGERIPQDISQVTSAPKIKKEMTIINWRWSAEKIHNWIRGLTPKPGMFTYLNNKRLRIYKSKVLNGNFGNPGTVVDINTNSIIISTGENLIALLEIQLEGKKKLLVSEFLKGYNIKIDTVLGK